MTKKQRVCSSCGQPLNGNEKQCPKCGSKLPQTQKYIVIGVVAVVVLIIVINTIVKGGLEYPDNKQTDTATATEPTVVTMAAGNDTAAAPDTAAPEPETTAAPEPTEPTVGDTVTIKDVDITLLAVEENYGESYFTPDAGKVFLLFNLEAVNNSKSVKSFGIYHISVFVDDYAASWSAAASSIKDSFSGDIAPGKKMNGYYGVEVPEDWKTAEIHIAYDALSSSTRNTAVFKYSK